MLSTTAKLSNGRKRSPVLMNQLYRVLKPLGWEFDRSFREFSHSHYHSFRFTLKHLEETNYFHFQQFENHNAMNLNRCRRVHLQNYFSVQVPTSPLGEILKKLVRYRFIPESHLIEIQNTI